MIDIVAEGLRAAALRSPLAFPLALGAGIVTSIGPCAAPRYVAVAAMSHGARRPWAIVTAFAAGLIGAYVALGSAAGALATLSRASTMAYAGLAAVLAIGGIATLLRASGSERRDAHCCEVPPRAKRASAGGAFLLGAGGALVVSPCCTPVLAGIAGLTLTSGRAFEGTLLLAAFGAGHALPVLAAGAAGERLSNLLRRFACAQAPAIVSGSLMLALAMFYGTLA